NSNLVDSAVGTLLLDGTGACYGMLKADAGATIRFSSSGFNLVGSSLSGAGTVSLVGGTLIVSNNVSSTVSNFVHSGGTLTGSGTLTNSGAYLWTSGVESDSGTSTFTGPLTINGFVTLSGRTLWPMLSVLQTNGNVSMGGGAVINIPQSATYKIVDDSGLTGLGGTIYNWGTFEKTGGGDNAGGFGTNTSRVDGTLINSDLAASAAGTLVLDGTGACYGMLKADAGATIRFSSSGFNLVGSSLSGAGTVSLVGGTLIVSNNVSSTVSNFVHSGGTLTGSGTLTNSGAYLWTSGVESDSGTSTFTGPLTINGFVTLSGRTLWPMLSVLQTNGNVSMGGGAVINIPQSATYKIV